MANRSRKQNKKKPQRFKTTNKANKRNAMGRSVYGADLRMKNDQSVLREAMARRTPFQKLKSNVQSGYGKYNTKFQQAQRNVSRSIKGGVRGASGIMNGLGMTTLASAAVIGSAAASADAFMKGGMNQAQDIMMDRYMRDSRYSSRLLTQTNLGSATGNSTISIGNHTGLSLAMSRRRHG